MLLSEDPMRFVFVFFTCFLAATISAQAKPSYGAIAVVPGQGLDFHGVAIESSASEARDAAMKRCGKSRCKIVQDYVPGQCMHVVTGYHQIFWNNALFSKREKSSILQACRKTESGCKVIKSACMAE
jgi:hypothetical protein